MDRLLIIFIFFICLITTFGCNPNEQNGKIIQKTYAGQIIPIDFNDSNYAELSSYAIDTLTQDGWAIKYFVKNDSTKYHDIYIKCSKGNVSSIYKSESVLQFRRYFIPQYTGENKKHLFFWHGCATDCQAVLTFSKDSVFAKDYTSVIDYSISYGQIAYVTDGGAKDNNPFQISIVDLSKNKEHLVQFKNLCMYAAHKESCIDTIIFKKNKVLVKATLTIDNYYRDKEATEEKTVNLK